MARFLSQEKSPLAPVRTEEARRAFTELNREYLPTLLVKREQFQASSIQYITETGTQKEGGRTESESL
jgi:hypothetical protein